MTNLRDYIEDFGVEIVKNERLYMKDEIDKDEARMKYDDALDELMENVKRLMGIE